MLTACIITLKLTVYLTTRGYLVVSYWCPAVTEIRQTHLKTQNYYHPVKTIQTSHIQTREEKAVVKADLFWNPGILSVQILDNMIIIYGVLLLHMSSCSSSLCTTSENLNKSAVLTHRLCDTMQKDTLSGSFSTCFHSVGNAPGKNWNDPLHLYSAAGFTDAYLVILTPLQRCICTCSTCTIW